uniref:Solute carrier family 30 member 2 n=1 Tax=Canis lupus familiaris TaxID=9615 RepID=A0A8C0Q6E6_CANLF
MRPAERGGECAQPPPSPKSGGGGSSRPGGAGAERSGQRRGTLCGRPALPHPAAFCTRRAASHGRPGPDKAAGAGRSGGRARAAGAGAAGGRPGAARAGAAAGSSGRAGGERGPPGRWVRAARGPARNSQGARDAAAARGCPDPAGAARAAWSPRRSSTWWTPSPEPGGYLAHSLAIMTDAAHLLTDFASMLVSLFSLWMSSRPATKTMNFGWQRAEILGALLSVLSIWVVTGVLVFLAVERLISGDYEIEGGTMLITSGCAVAVNIIMGLTLHQSSHGHSHDSSQQQENPSVRAAFIHVIGDFLQSVGILVAAYILYFKPEYKYVDPICTFLFSILVLGTTLTILRDVIVVLMEGTPKGVDFTAVRDLLLSVEGVEALHSLHIWALTVTQPVLSVHIAIAQNADGQAVLKAASTRLQGKFRFHTITIQIEDYSEDMKDCQECQGPSD